MGRSDLGAAADAILRPERLYCPEEVATGAPRSAGVYGWYFDQVPGGIDITGCHRHEGLTLLYCGISPKKPSSNGSPASRSHLHQRLRTHVAGNAAGSTLRLTLGCLLEREIGTILRRVGTRGRLTFTNPGERLLDAWLHAHARIAWVTHPEPWEIEEAILRSRLPLPLNIDSNPNVTLSRPLSELRSAARRRAAALPLIGDSGGPRRTRAG